MAGLLEIVFEDVTQEVMLPFLERVVSDAESVVSAECSEDFWVWKNGQIQLDAISAAIEFDEDLSVLVNVRGLRFMGVIVNSALIRVLKYQGKFDLDISFDEHDFWLCGVGAVNALLAYSKAAAKKFEFVSCYFGMEPASDEATRFFTNDILGPLK
ncbi:hypothetical protein ABH908_004893 [Pseudomonas frederiksbergensis]|jgi:hypothetical protein|uniref:hypothetical protein n=1 Tax=Pseudomonas TaxID=286 RepID=UPI00110D9E08|nr:MULTISPECIES: hypothetical protein [unclassified Pseudomonas]MBD9619064.1 hypothetical protein [Pseudomonas sp. PDM07]QDV97039.1 hypothetical protein FFH90_023175 [Pseudomonas sp. ATCC 43928]CAH0182122.1 hypothetical protein SRABI130_01541 [Pseudomonas sp. Bi130]